ncbi:MAG: GntR family transcriptional regulator [Bauldia litoralis]
MTADAATAVADVPPLQGGVVPRYRQIEAILRDKIWTGELGPGDQVPTEDDLTRLFSVSRATVRQALQILENDGLIYREVGRGTFVNAIVEQLPQRLIAIEPDTLLNPDIFDRITLHRTGTLAARGEVETSLEVAYGAEVSFFVRVYFLNGEAVGGEKVYVLPPIARALTRDDMVVPNIAAVVARTAGRPIQRFDRRIGAVSADARSSVLFQTFSGAPLIAIHRTSYDGAGGPVEHSHTLFRSDRCQINLDP